MKNPSLAHRAGIKGQVKGQMKADHLQVNKAMASLLPINVNGLIMTGKVA